jgi:hypothetical protein
MMPEAIQLGRDNLRMLPVPPGRTLVSGRRMAALSSGPRHRSRNGREIGGLQNCTDMKTVTVLPGD